MSEQTFFFFFFKDNCTSFEIQVIFKTHPKKAHEILSTNKAWHDLRKVLTYTDKIMTHGNKNETVMERKRRVQYFLFLSLLPVFLRPFKNTSRTALFIQHTLSSCPIFFSHFFSTSSPSLWETPSTGHVLGQLLFSNFRHGWLIDACAWSPFSVPAVHEWGTGLMQVSVFLSPDMQLYSQSCFFFRTLRWWGQ